MSVAKKFTMGLSKFIALNAALGAGKVAHSKIKEQGGYFRSAREGASSIYGAVKDSYRFLRDIKGVKFDKEGAAEMLRNAPHNAKRVGVKTLEFLTHMVAEGTELTNDVLRMYIPSREEIETDYSGIGSSYEGILLRKHYEECLSFHEKAQRKIPDDVELKDEILSDLRASASGKKSELRAFYNSQDTEETKKKVGVVNKYLKHIK